VTKQFFALPDATKDYPSGNPLLGPNQWPDLPGFAHAVTSYYNAVLALGRLLLRGFALALGEPPESFARVVTKAPSQLRLIHYPFDPDAHDDVGIGAHTDYECFALLKPTAPGLEVRNGAGEWIDVPLVPDTSVINIGDMLETWTNGEFIATTHRVRKVREERYSFPLFFCVDYHTRITPLPRFVRPGRDVRPSLIASTCSRRPHRASATSSGASHRARSPCLTGHWLCPASGRKPKQRVRP
jgi:isopenicillin N synthase-like dioxygenase